MSEMTFNTSLINILSSKGVTVHFFNYYDFYKGVLPRRPYCQEITRKSSRHYMDEYKRLEIAKKFVEGAANIYRNLRYYNGRGKDVQSFMDDIDC